MMVSSVEVVGLALEIADMGMTMEAVVRGTVSADDLIVLPIVLKLIFEHQQDRAEIVLLNPQFPSDSGARPVFVVMLDPLDCCNCLSWHPRSDHQYHDSMHPDLR
jgi:hypothetical protein